MTIHLGPSSTPGRNLMHILTLSQWTAWLTVAPLNVELNDLVAFFKECQWEQEMNARNTQLQGLFSLSRSLLCPFKSGYNMYFAGLLLLIFIVHSL